VWQVLPSVGDKLSRGVVLFLITFHLVCECYWKKQEKVGEFLLSGKRPPCNYAITTLTNGSQLVVVIWQATKHTRWLFVKNAHFARLTKCVITLTASTGKRNVTLRCPSFRLSVCHVSFLTLMRRAAHTWLATGSSRRIGVHFRSSITNAVMLVSFCKVALSEYILRFFSLPRWRFGLSDWLCICLCVVLAYCD